MWPYDDELSPNIFGRMGAGMMQTPRFDTSMPQIGMTLPGGDSYPEFKQQRGLVEDSGGSYAGMMLPLMITQIGAALMQDPENRAKVLANLPATMLAAAKMSRDSATEREKMRLYGKIYGKGESGAKYGKDLMVNSQTGEWGYPEYGKTMGPEWRRANEKEQKEYVAMMADEGGNVREVYRGSAQPTIHNVPKPLPQHMVVPPDFTGTVPPGMTPHIAPRPLQQPVVIPPGGPVPNLQPGQRPYFQPGVQEPRLQENQTFKILEKYNSAQTPEEKAAWGAILKNRGFTEQPGKPGWLWGAGPPTMLPPGIDGGAPKPMGQPTGRKEPSQADLAQYQRVLQANRNNPEKIKAIQQKALAAWGYLP